MAPPDKRAALEDLREVIRGAAPGATELINYGVPMFRRRQEPRQLRRGQDHCSFYAKVPR